jgi:hypothetical protein
MRRGCVNYGQFMEGSPLWHCGPLMGRSCAWVAYDRGATWHRRAVAGESDHVARPRTVGYFIGDAGVMNPAILRVGRRRGYRATASLAGASGCAITIFFAGGGFHHMHSPLKVRNVRGRWTPAHAWRRVAETRKKVGGGVRHISEIRYVIP